MSQAIITALTVGFLMAANAVAFLSFLSIAAYRARREGFQRGVLHGWMIGRFPETAYRDRRFKEACALTDKLEADVMWAELKVGGK